MSSSLSSGAPTHDRPNAAAERAGSQEDGLEEPTLLDEVQALREYTAREIAAGCLKLPTWDEIMAERREDEEDAEATDEP